MFDNEFLCSDLRDIRTISKQLPKGITLITGGYCLEMSQMTNNVGEDYLPSSRDFLPLSFSPLQQKGKNYCFYDAGFQWICYVICTFHIYHSTRTKLWGLLYFFCCLIIYISSLFDYLVFVNYFIFIVSFLWLWIVVGKLIFCASLKRLFKSRCWVHV